MASTMNGNSAVHIAATNNRSSVMLNKDQIEELSEVFNTIDLNGDGEIEISELQLALKTVGMDLPGYEVRQLMERFSRQITEGKTALSFWEFSNLYTELKEKKDFGRIFTKQVKSAENIHQIQGQSEQSQQQGLYHSVRNEEEVAFSNWMNSNLSGDPDLANLLPIDPNGKDLYTKINDGLVICKLINLAVPETIDERAINKKKLDLYRKRENLTLALSSAQAIGCNIVNIDSVDLNKGTPHLVLGLLWQIIRIGLFSQIDLVHVPGLVRLLREGETLADLQKLSPEQILIRWVNYHLEKAGVDRRLNNFTTDVVDSEIYTHLLKQIAPADRAVSLDPLRIRDDNVGRANAMLNEADKLNARAFVSANDVANGVYKLNLAFVANLFNTWPGLKPPAEDEDLGDLEEMIEETREEKTYRNWMNSMGVQPHVNWLYSDLSNGVVIFQLYDIIRPNMVNWKQVVTKSRKLNMMMDQIQNCNYAVDLGKQLKFSLVGLQGKDIYDGNRTLTLALVWQLMRAYSLTILAQCAHGSDEQKLATDREIIEWVNNKLRACGKTTQLRGFQDQGLSDGKIIADLVDCIQPNIINYDILRDSSTYDEKLANAKYVITCARKLGAKIYALPEDIVEVKPKMVMTVFACLMARDFMPNVREAQSPTSPTSPTF